MEVISGGEGVKHDDDVMNKKQGPSDLRQS